MRRETVVTDPAELTLLQNRASTEKISLQGAIKCLTWKDFNEHTVIKRCQPMTSPLSSYTTSEDVNLG